MGKFYWSPSGHQRIFSRSDKYKISKFVLVLYTFVQKPINFTSLHFGLFPKHIHLRQSHFL